MPIAAETIYDLIRELGTETCAAYTECFKKIGEAKLRRRGFDPKTLLVLNLQLRESGQFPHLGGSPWSDEYVLKAATEGDARCRYAVTSHIKANVEPSTLEVRVLRVADKECIGKLSQSFKMEDPGPAIVSLARQLVQLLGTKAQIETRPLPAIYALPPPDWASAYLLRVEQLLAVRCASIEGVGPTFLSGQREIVIGDIQLCLVAPRSASVRLLLAETLLAMKCVRPEIMGEFKQQVMDLQREHPLSEPAQGIVQKMIAEALSPSTPTGAQRSLLYLP